MNEFSNNIEELKHDPNSIYESDHEENNDLDAMTHLEDKRRFIQDLKSINVFKMVGEEKELNIEATKVEREKFIEEKGLADVESYKKGFELGEDENGLQILKLKD